MENFGVASEADAGEFAGHQAVVLPERQQNDIDERIDGEDQKTDEKREQEQPRLRKGAEGHALAVCARAHLRRLISTAPPLGVKQEHAALFQAERPALRRAESPARPGQDREARRGRPAGGRARPCRGIALQHSRAEGGRITPAAGCFRRGRLERSPAPSARPSGSASAAGMPPSSTRRAVLHNAVQLVDGRRAEKSAAKRLDRVFIETAGGVLLLEHAVTQQDDAVGDAAGLPPDRA